MRSAPATGGKETRGKPVSAQAEAGKVKIVRGHWSDEFVRTLENFPAGKHDDEVDGLSGAYEHLRTAAAPFAFEFVPGSKRMFSREAMVGLGADCRDPWLRRGGMPY